MWFTKFQECTLWLKILILPICYCQKLKPQYTNANGNKQWSRHWGRCWSAEGSAGAGASPSLGIQKVRTVEAATNIALRGAHFRHDATPMLFSHLATCFFRLCLDTVTRIMAKRNTVATTFWIIHLLLSEPVSITGVCTISMVFDCSVFTSDGFSMFHACKVPSPEPVSTYK